MIYSLFVIACLKLCHLQDLLDDPCILVQTSIKKSYMV